MALRRYLVIGHPLGFDFAEIADKNVGTEFELDMDPAVERLLADSRSIQILDENVKATRRKAEALDVSAGEGVAAKAESEVRADDAPKQTSRDRK